LLEIIAECMFSIFRGTKVTEIGYELRVIFLDLQNLTQTFIKSNGSTR
jgi:hypothetical protein